MTDQTIPEEAIEAAARVLHVLHGQEAISPMRKRFVVLADVPANGVSIGSCLKCRRDAERMLTSAYPHLRQQWEREHCNADGHIAFDEGEIAAEYERRYGEKMLSVRDELREKPLHEGLLADNERWGYSMIERVIFRHSFTDHDCQTIDCKAMFVWNSTELTALLHDAYRRGYNEAARGAAQPGGER